MSKQQRPFGAAPLGSRDFYEKPNPYWIDRAAAARAAPKKRPQVTSRLTNKN